MAEAKTRPTKESVKGFLAKVPDEARRADCEVILELMRKATGEEPVMWGTSIVGFGRYLQEYANGRTSEWPIIGFSPRKTDLTLYLVLGSAEVSDLMAKLGKHKTSKACLYIKRLSDVDMKVLTQLIKKSVEKMKAVRVWPA
jgi:hypothetical protein